MALPTIAGVAKITLGWLIGSDASGMTVMHYRYSSGAPTPGDLASTAENLAGILAADAAILGVMGTHVTFESVTITDLSTMANPHGFSASAGVGTRTGGALPSGAAVLINLGIERRYRGGKPRSYMPWGTATDLSASNHFTAGAVTDFGDAYAALQTDVDAVGPMNFGQQVNVGYFSGYTLGPAQPGGFRKKISTPLGVPHVDNITSSSASLNVGSQRRRNRA